VNPYTPIDLSDDVEAQGPKTVMRYDHGRENLDQNAVNFLGYDEE
jgi:hypothetical protein